eukprot:g38156.t1
MDTNMGMPVGTQRFNKMGRRRLPKAVRKVTDPHIEFGGMCQGAKVPLWAVGTVAAVGLWKAPKTTMAAGGVLAVTCLPKGIHMTRPDLDEEEGLEEQER